MYDIGDIAKKFNKTIKKLVNLMNESISNNILFDTIKRRTKLIIDSHPLFLLEEGGSQLFVYRDYIKDNRFEDLLNNSNDLIQNNESIQEYINNGDVSPKDINMLLNLLQEIWIKYDDDEKKIIKKLLKTLLSEYCKFITIKN
jgi:hypothetical protein